MINKVVLIGRTGKEPDLRRLEGGSAVATVSLATSESYKDKDGNFQESTQWHNIVAWGDLAERLAKHPKGTLMYLEGKITYRKYADKDGIERNVTDIVANSFRVLEKREGATTEQSAPAQQTAPAQNQPFNDPSLLNGNDLPF